MDFLEQLLARLPAAPAPVRGVWIGPFWTVVQTEAGAGLAATCLANAPTHGPHAQHLPNAGSWVGRDARELAAGAASVDPLARSVGLAALNALLPEPTGRISERNAGELAAEKGAGKTVGVVGWFPFIPRLRESAARVETFERDAEAARVEFMRPFTTQDKLEALSTIAGRIEGVKAEIAKIEDAEHPPLTMEGAWPGPRYCLSPSLSALMSL